MTTAETVEVQPVKVGDAVQGLNENYEPFVGLVTCVHGEFRDEEGAYIPCINVVYVSSDVSKRDPYGQQLERMSSLQHFNQTVNMPRPGRFWKNL